MGDEPTGNLDSMTADEMFDLLGRLNAEGKTILFVTHDRELAGRARMVTIRDGVVVADFERRRCSPPRCAVGHRPHAAARAHVVHRRHARCAVASISFLAIPALIDRAMQAEDSGEVDWRTRRRCGRSSSRTRSWQTSSPERGGRAEHAGRHARARRRATGAALVIGVRDFARQEVDLVRLDSAKFPGPREVLTEVQNANVGVFGGGTGDGDGRRRQLRITGVGRNTPNEVVQDENVIVLCRDGSTRSRR